MSRFCDFRGTRTHPPTAPGERGGVGGRVGWWVGWLVGGGGDKQKNRTKHMGVPLPSVPTLSPHQTLCMLAPLWAAGSARRLACPLLGSGELPEICLPPSG